MTRRASPRSERHRPLLVVLDLHGTVYHWPDFGIRSPGHLIWAKSPHRQRLSLSRVIAAVDGRDGDSIADGEVSDDDVMAAQVQRWRHAMALAGIWDSDHHIALCHEVIRARHPKLFPDAVELLRWLTYQQIPWGVCSNASPDVWPKVQALLPPDVSQPVTAALSWRVGALKPHPRMYTAIDCGHVSDAIFVGDLWHADVLGPLREGFGAAFLNRHDESEPPHFESRGRFLGRITTLTDLPALLRSRMTSGPGRSFAQVLSEVSLGDQS